MLHTQHWSMEKSILSCRNQNISQKIGWKWKFFHHLSTSMIHTLIKSEVYKIKFNKCLIYLFWVRCKPWWGTIHDLWNAPLYFRFETRFIFTLFIHFAIFIILMFFCYSCFQTEHCFKFINEFVFFDFELKDKSRHAVNC